MVKDLRNVDLRGRGDLHQSNTEMTDKSAEEQI